MTAYGDIWAMTCDEQLMAVLKEVSGCSDPHRDFSAHEAIEYLNAHNHDQRVVSLIAQCRVRKGPLLQTSSNRTGTSPQSTSIKERDAS